MDLLYLFRILLRRIWLLVTIPVVAAALTAFFTIRAPDQYKSTAQLSTGFTIKGGISLGTESFNIREADAKFNNLIEQINSPLMMGVLSYHLLIHDLTDENPFRIIEQEKITEFGLTDSGIKEAVNILSKKISNIELLSSFEENEINLLKVLKEFGYDDASLRYDLDIRRINYTDYVSVSFISENNLLSAFVVNTLCSEYIRYHNTINSQKSSESVVFFENLVERKKEELAEISSRLKDYKSSNRFLNFDAESEAKINQIKEYEAEKEKEVHNISSIEFSIKLLDDKLAGGSATTVEELSNQINVLRSKISETNDRYVSGGSTDAALADSIAVMNAKMNRIVVMRTQLGTEKRQREEIVQEKEKLLVDLQIAKRRLESIDSRLSSLKVGVAVFASQEATVSSLIREVDIASQEYLDAQNKLNQAKNASLIEKEGIEQILLGQPAIRRESSKLMIKTGLAGISSFAMCLFVIVFVEYIDQRIKTIPRFKRATDLKLIGTINNLKNKIRDYGTLFKLKELKSVEDDVFRHSLRKLRYDLTTQKSKKILVTSLKEGEGKSFVIMALAASIGMIDKKVLIIDTNFRNNTLSEMKSEKTKAIENKVVKEVAIKNVNYKGGNANGLIFENNIFSTSGSENVHIIGNKGGIGSPSEILAGKDFGSMLQNLETEYDFIFMEGSSMNDYSDSFELSEYVDKILVVFDAQSTLGQIDQESINFLRNLNGKFLGSILNKIKMENLDMN